MTPQGFGHSGEKKAKRTPQFRVFTRKAAEEEIRGSWRSAALPSRSGRVAGCPGGFGKAPPLRMLSTFIHLPSDWMSARCRLRQQGRVMIRYASSFYISDLWLKFNFWIDVV